MGAKKPYLPADCFKLNGNLIYNLQEVGGFEADGMPTLGNDIMIRIEQCKGGKNPMPDNILQELKEYLTKSANIFLKHMILKEVNNTTINKIE